MTITIQSTTETVEIVAPGGGSVPARLWQGTTDSGISVHALVTLIAAPRDADLSQFDRELQQQRPPNAEPRAFPLRLIL